MVNAVATIVCQSKRYVHIVGLKRAMTIEKGIFSSHSRSNTEAFEWPAPFDYPAHLNRTAVA
jgi:hypothetical protein